MLGWLRKFCRDRRGATAVIIAMMSIPLIVASGAAVDFSRIASARSQLQYAADSAALAGAGAYQVNKDGTAAYNVANTAFNAAAATLSSYATVTSTVGALCNPGGTSGVTCGTKSAANGVTSVCPGSTIYCVEVTAQAVLRNSLLGFLIPTDTLKITAVAQSTGTSSVSTGNFFHTGVGNGSDLSGIYTYAVPTDSAGNPQYSNTPTPNSYCSNSSYGPIQYLPTLPAGNGVNGCNYVLIGQNGNNSGTGTINFNSSDPLGFTFVNFTGGNVASGKGDLDDTNFNLLNLVSNLVALNLLSSAYHYTNEIYVTLNLGILGSSTTYFPQGDIISGIALWATCPAHNLYGSINAYPDGNAADDMVPYQDSINVFSSAWEMLGYPPTHSTNHALLPFLGPANNSILGLPLVTVRAICPQWPTYGTSIAGSATTTNFTPASLPAGYSPVGNTAGFPTASNVPVYSTYYPDATYKSGTGVYPPAIAACTPASNATDGGVTPSWDDPWWGWSPPNNTGMDLGGAAENPGGSAVTNCTSTRLNSGGTAITATQNATQSSAYNNCAFLIQPLGTSVPATNGVPDLPDYYTYTVDPTATTGNASNIVSSVPTLPYASIPAYGAGALVSGMAPVFDGVSNSNAAGSVPTRVSIAGSGPYVVTEPPAYGTDFYPPEDTSHQCYNPQANGISSSQLPGIDQPNNDTGGAIDPVANPEFGAVLCNTNPPDSFVLFWNDMGSWSTLPPSLTPAPQYNDDLGYTNAVTEFTCPTPGNPGSTGPPSLIY